MPSQQQPFERGARHRDRFSAWRANRGGAALAQGRLERSPAAAIPAVTQAASSSGASPDAPAAPSRVLPSALKIGTPPATVTTCGAKAKPGVSLRALGHVRGREAPGGDRLRLGQREIHHARAVAVHPQRRNQVTARCRRRRSHGSASSPRLRGAAVTIAWQLASSATRLRGVGLGGHERQKRSTLRRCAALPVRSRRATAFASGEWRTDDARLVARGSTAW